MSQLQRAGLAELESVITASCSAFVASGEALTEICERKLHRPAYPTFEDYCRGRWQMTPQHAYRLIQAFAVIEALSPTGYIPETERQARELAALPPPMMRLVWLQALGEAGEQPTAAALAGLVADARAAKTPAELVALIRQGEDAPALEIEAKPVNWPRRLGNAERVLVQLQALRPDLVERYGERLRAAVEVLEELAREVAT